MLYIDADPEETLLDFVERLVDSAAPPGAMIRALMMLIYNEDGEALEARIGLWASARDNPSYDAVLSWLSRRPEMDPPKLMADLPGFRKYQDAYAADPAPEHEARAYWVGEEPPGVPSFPEDEAGDD